MLIKNGWIRLGRFLGYIDDMDKERERVLELLKQVLNVKTLGFDDKSKQDALTAFQDALEDEKTIKGAFKHALLIASNGDNGLYTKAFEKAFVLRNEKEEKSNYLRKPKPKEVKEVIESPPKNKVATVVKDDKPKDKDDKVIVNVKKEVKEENTSKTNGSTRLFNILKNVLIILVIVAVIVLMVNVIQSCSIDKDKFDVAETTATTAAETEAIMTIQERAEKILAENGWKPGDYVTGSAIDLSKDKSTGGKGSFKKDGIKTTSDLGKYMKSGKDSAKAFSNQTMEIAGGVTLEDVQNANNWIAFQSLVYFSYKGNTLFVNGKIANSGLDRAGNPGDIFFIFIPPSPSNESYAFARGGCANPQTEPPVVVQETTPPTSPPETTPPTDPPETTPPTDPPETTEQKDPSQDPAPKGNAPVGGGVNQDTGPGDYIPPESMEQPPSTPYIAPVAPTS